MATKKEEIEVESLGQIVAIREKIRVAPLPAVKALHAFIFGSEGGLDRRKKLCEFG